MFPALGSDILVLTGRKTRTTVSPSPEIPLGQLRGCLAQRCLSGKPTQAIVLKLKFKWFPKLLPERSASLNTSGELREFWSGKRNLVIGIIEEVNFKQSELHMMIVSKTCI